MTMFWIVVYCLNAGRCYVSQSPPDGPHRYATEQACLAEVHGGKEIKKNSTCQAVTDVNCVNGGSVCTFAPASDSAAAKLKSMVVIPK